MHRRGLGHQLILALLCGLAGAGVHAQAPAPPSPSAGQPFAIVDNSFFVEEAFNQDVGVFQNIFGLIRMNGEWNASFTQEWPVTSRTHQLSYTLAWSSTRTASGVEDTLVNYRYQVMTEGSGRPAFAPRASLILPTGRADLGFGSASPGLQVNLPFSKQDGDVYLHWNAGVTWLFRARRERDENPATSAGLNDCRSLVSPFVAVSAVYRLKPMAHLMLESVVSSDARFKSSGFSRDTSFLLSPGVRVGWNIGRTQVVVGAAIPTVWSGGTADTGAFGYFSYELPFAR